MSVADLTRISPLAALTTRVFNPVMRLFAGSLPGLGLLTHRGRRTGRLYRTPLLVLKRGDRYLIGLWYGTNVHWVKNVLARGECEMRIRGRNIQMVEPELVADPTLQLLPRPLALAGRLVRLSHLLRLRATPTPST
jgi:deazaflavin-dependent oxidoreductase (nitroreductase family)